MYIQLSLELLEHHGEWCSCRCWWWVASGGWLWWVVAVGVRGGGWVVLVGSDGCWLQQWCWVAITDVGIGFCLTQCLV